MRNTLFLVAILASFAVNAQFNTTLRSNLPYDTGVNDIWGYVAPDGIEYAIVGLETGVELLEVAFFAAEVQLAAQRALKLGNGLYRAVRGEFRQPLDQLRKAGQHVQILVDDLLDTHKINMD